MKTIIDAARSLIELMPGSFSKFQDCQATLMDNRQTIEIESRFTNGSLVTTHYSLPRALDDPKDFDPVAAASMFKGILGAYVRQNT